MKIWKTFWIWLMPIASIIVAIVLVIIGWNEYQIKDIPNIARHSHLELIEKFYYIAPTISRIDDVDLACYSEKIISINPKNWQDKSKKAESIKVHIDGDNFGVPAYIGMKKMIAVVYACMPDGLIYVGRKITDTQPGYTIKTISSNFNEGGFTVVWQPIPVTHSCIIFFAFSGIFLILFLLLLHDVPSLIRLTKLVNQVELRDRQKL